jgi:hypothetical protein
MAALLALSFLLGGGLAVRGLVNRLRWPTDIAVCATGLRWRQGGRQRAFLWSEVTNADRQIKYVPRYNQGGLVGAIAAMNNPEAMQKIDTLTITFRWGESRRFSSESTTDYLKFASTVAQMWGDDVKQSAVRNVTAAWMVARGVNMKPEEKPGRTYY